MSRDYTDRRPRRGRSPARALAPLASWLVLAALAAGVRCCFLRTHLLLNEIAILALFALSLDLILGYAGIVSLGHAAFFGFGAYAAALFAKHVLADPLVGLAVAVGVACGCSALVTSVAGPARLRPDAADGDARRRARSCYELANRFDWLTGGADGLQGVVMGPLLGRFEFDLAGRVGVRL